LVRQNWRPPEPRTPDCKDQQRLPTLPDDRLEACFQALRKALKDPALSAFRRQQASRRSRGSRGRPPAYLYCVSPPSHSKAGYTVRHLPPERLTSGRRLFRILQPRYKLDLHLALPGRGNKVKIIQLQGVSCIRRGSANGPFVVR